MERHINYLVQVQCQPSPIGYEEQIVQSLNHCFNVIECRSSSTGLTLELGSDHPMAYGAIKDLADLVVENLTERNLQLQSGVINRVEQNPLLAAVGAFYRGIIGKVAGTREGVLGFLAGGPVHRIASGLLGGPRLVPVMYFHRDVVLDLMLTAKVRRLAMRPLPGPN